MSDDRAIRVALAAAAGVVGGGTVAVAWAGLGPIGGAVIALIAGFLAGAVAGTGRGAVLAVVCATAPPLSIDLLVVPTPSVELGGFFQVAYGLAISFLAVLALVGAVLGAAGARAEQLDPVRSRPLRIALTAAAAAVLGGWLLLGAVVAATSI